MTAQRIEAGQPAHDFHLTDEMGQTHTLHDYRGEYLLLSLYRSPDCALCSLRLYQLRLAYHHLRAAHVAVLVVFEAESPTIQRLTHRHPLPFPVVADPQRVMFDEYAVRASWWGLRGTLRLGAVWQAWRHHVTGTLTTGRIHQLPADLLIGPDGVVRVAYYGNDTGDHLALSTLETYVDAPLLGDAQAPLVR